MVTVAHKVRNVNPADVTVRLGDWNPQKNDDKVSDFKKINRPKSGMFV